MIHTLPYSSFGSSLPADHHLILSRTKLSPHNPGPYDISFFSSVEGLALGFSHDYSVVNCISYCQYWAVLRRH